MMGLVCSYLGLLVCNCYGRLEWSEYCDGTRVGASRC